MVTATVYFCKQLVHEQELNAAIVLTALTMVPGLGCGKTDSRVPVHPVLGAIQFQGWLRAMEPC